VVFGRLPEQRAAVANSHTTDEAWCHLVAKVLLGLRLSVPGICITFGSKQHFPWRLITRGVN
jgi:hypothetical protein